MDKLKGDVKKREDDIEEMTTNMKETQENRPKQRKT